MKSKAPSQKKKKKQFVESVRHVPLKRLLRDVYKHIFSQTIVKNSWDAHCQTGTYTAWITQYPETDSAKIVHLRNKDSDEDAKCIYKRASPCTNFCHDDPDKRNSIEEAMLNVNGRADAIKIKNFLFHWKTSMRSPIWLKTADFAVDKDDFVSFRRTQILTSFDESE